MTRKDYKLIADRIRILKETNDIDDFIYELSQDFEDDNPRFNPIKFCIACGVTP